MHEMLLVRNIRAPVIPTVSFMGEIPSSSLMQGYELAAALSLSAGTDINSEDSWLKWEVDDKVIYYAKRPFKAQISWNDLNDVGAIDGSRMLPIQGNFYSVSVPMGTNPTPGVQPSIGYDVHYASYSEWDLLMLPLLQSGYTNIELVMSSSGGSGSQTLCREVYGASGDERVFRGLYGGNYLGSVNRATSNTSVGWRPRLELMSV